MTATIKVLSPYIPPAPTVMEWRIPIHPPVTFAVWDTDPLPDVMPKIECITLKLAIAQGDRTYRWYIWDWPDSMTLDDAHRYLLRLVYPQEPTP